MMHELSRPLSATENVKNPQQHGLATGPNPQAECQVLSEGFVAFALYCRKFASGVSNSP